MTGYYKEDFSHTAFCCSVIQSNEYADTAIGERVSVISSSKTITFGYQVVLTTAHFVEQHLLYIRSEVLSLA